MSTKKRIPPKFWGKNQRATGSYKNALELNRFLGKVTDACEKIHLAYLNDGKLDMLTVAKFKAELNRELGFTKQRNLLNFIVDFEVKKRNAPNTKPASADVYKNLHRDLLAYTKKYGVVSFLDIDMVFFDKFIKFLYSEKMSKNTAARRIKALKTIMRQAESEGVKVNHTYKSSVFHIKETEPFKIYLTVEEIESIYKHDFSSDKKLERSRDLFVVGCWTGLRYSDFSRIKPENIQARKSEKGENIEVISITPKKTAGSTIKPVIIPLHPIVKAILEKYDYQLPKVLNQKLNYHLKDIAATAKINSPLIYVENRAGKNHTVKALKWEKVCTHTARRSFATNMYKLGYRAIDIMKITNHKTESSFMRYICISNEETAMRIAETDTFSQKLRAV